MAKTIAAAVTAAALLIVSCDARNIAEERGDPFAELNCDFDTAELCHYTNSLDDDFDWTRNHGATASIGTGPDTDHTTGQSTGYYVYAEASGRKQFDKARLDGVTSVASTNGACVTFWYHMYGANMGSLRVYTSETDGVLGPVQWSRSGYTTVNQWVQAFVRIDAGIQFKLVFVAEIGDGYQGDIAIDDISVTDGVCHDERDSLALLNCNFETSDLCSYTNSQNDDFDWTLGQGKPSEASNGPEADHTTGTSNGIYIYTKSRGKYEGDVVRLNGVTAVAPANGACLMFWFHIFGFDVGSLAVYMEETNGDLGPALWSWTWSTSVNPDWMRATVSIDPGREFKPVFIGTMGRSWSAISIDDISVTDGICHELPTDENPFIQQNCEFDTNFCHYSNSKSVNYNWERNKGATATDGTGPDADHTTGNETGYYVYFDTEWRKKNDLARLESGESVAPPNGACASFWYHMYGRDMGSLTVFTSEMEYEFLGPAQWSTAGSTGNNWVQASVSIDPDSEFKLVFVGMIGDGDESEIAIDDISVTDGQCYDNTDLSALDCDFDSISFCHYINSLDDDFNWAPIRGNTTSPGTGPDADHTTQTMAGYYIYAEASYKNPSDKARLDGVKVHAPADSACLTFWYHMYGANMGSLTVYTSETDGVLGPVQWSRSGYTKLNQWMEAKVSISSGNEIQPIFVAEIGNGYQSDIAIDDISVTEGECQDVPTDKPDPYFNVDCDFETMGFCLYTNSKDDIFDWTRNEEGKAGSFMYGPNGDHTTGTKMGYYIYADSYNKLPNSKARLDGVPSVAPAGGCITFWYHMYGAGIGSLKVYTSETDGVLGPVQWSRSGYTKEKEWKEARVNIEPNSEFQLIFISEVGDSGQPDIAIDDISFADGICQALPTETPDPYFLVDCDFDSMRFCLYTNSVDDDFNWIRDRGKTGNYGTGPFADHTTGNLYSGYYLYAKATNQVQGDKARLDGRTAVAPATGACITFWYHMYGANMGSLRVYTSETDGVLDPVQWSRSGHVGYQWMEARVSIDSASEFQLIFVGEVGNGNQGDIAIDDVSLADGGCQAVTTEVADQLSFVNCDFNSISNCYYTNNPYDDFDWTRKRDGTPTSETGPDADHTTGTGYYMYTEVSYKKRFYKARLDGLISTAPANGACITFWYHMYGADIGSLTVYMSETDGVLGPVQWSRSGYTKEKEWKEARVSIDPASEFQLIFIGEVGDGDKGDIAIDDISASDGQCQGLLTDEPDVSFLVDCDFDTVDLCLYTNNPDADYDWERLQGKTYTDGTGPDADHTTGNGYYIYFRALWTLPSDMARLDGVTVTAPANGGCITFWYHMYGVSIGSLTVYTSETDGILGPAKWSHSGDTGVNQWMKAQVSIAPSSEFKLTFIGVAGPGWVGDIAIDDISFSDGECQGPPTPKPDPSFLVDCDFDGTISLCHYTNNLDDDFDWSRYSGRTPTNGTGPDADHTTGTMAGHYIYTEAAWRDVGDQARLDGVTAIAPANGACITFWYHMYGENIGSLRVYTSETDGVLGPVQWSQSGYTRLNQWKEAKLSIDPGSEFKLIFIGEIGYDNKGDIAVDDISLADGECKDFATERPDPYIVVDCDFDTLGFCHYTNSRSERFDWRRVTGETGSFGTSGPHADHTTGTVVGYYLYTEAYGQEESAKARIDSGLAVAPANGACITFWHHTYGTGRTGLLTVHTSDSDGVLGPARWTNSGISNLSQWIRVTLNIHPEKEFKLIFISEGGSAQYVGFMAIDDISVADGECSN